MNLFYHNTKTIVLLLTFLNIGAHMIGFYFEKDLYSLISSLVICELLLISFYFIITIYKWIVSDFRKIQAEQVNISSQISQSHNGTNKRIEKLEKDILDRIIISEEKYINTALSQKESLLEAINLLKEQASLSNNENKKELKFIKAFLEKIEKLSEESVNTASKNKEDLKKIDLILNEKANELNAEFSKVHTDSNSILKVIEDNNQIATNNSDELKTIITTVNEEANKLIQEFNRINSDSESVLKKLEDASETIAKNKEELSSIKTTVNEESNKLNKELTKLISDKDLELNKIIEQIHDLVESFKTKIAEEKINNASDIGNLEKIILNEINTILSKIDTSKLENHEVLGEISHDIRQSKSELESSIRKEISSNHDSQKNHIDFRLRKELNMVYDRLDALISIHEIIEPIAPLPIMHDWRITSDYAHTLLINLLEKKGSVLDIGSGVSTIIMGYALQKNGSGKVISLEHSKEYFEKTKQLIDSHNLQEFCTVYHCPLIEYELNEKKWLWYDVSSIKFPENINLVSIDGPPGATQPLARYPAIPILKKHLNKHTSIFLDDGNRDDEKEIVNLWAKENNYNLNVVTHGKGWVELTTK